jgi:antitoxin StbD
MEHINANLSISISELKKSPMALLNKAKGEPIAILNHNKPAAYLIPAIAYDLFVEILEERELTSLIKKRLLEKNQAIEVNLDDL